MHLLTGILNMRFLNNKSISFFIKLVSTYGILFFSMVYANENVNNYIKFSTDFDAKCVVRGGVMIYISNIHKNKTIKVTLERWFMDNKTGDRSRSILKPANDPEALGCSKVSNLKQEWRVKNAEWVNE
tara:strand:- start:411 stop:794 length:384 start_codon:yes stop_codon:yes gene_type:complete